MILLWGLSGDNPLEEVMQALLRQGTHFVFLDQRDILNTEAETGAGYAVAGVVRTPEQTINLSEITAAYLRVYDFRRLPDVAQAGPCSASWLRAATVESAIYSWVETTEALVVNRPSAMASNNSKPYQASLIKAHGFKIPATLITTDPAAAEEFWRQHGAVIYKSISGVRSIVSRLRPDDLERLADVIWCPTQFQQYIPGRDYRVHVVGEELFACEIVSEADDYRYASREGATVAVSPCELPSELGEQIRVMVGAMGLLLAGVDLRCTPDGQWYCFEVNPSPAFYFYEPETETPIAVSIAQLLAGCRQTRCNSSSAASQVAHKRVRNC